MLSSGTLDFHLTNTVVVMWVLARACCVIHKQIVVVKVLENGLCLCLTYAFYSSQLSLRARKKKIEFPSACSLGKQLIHNACPGLRLARLTLRANGRNNSQHCCANNVGSCCVRIGSGGQMGATTPSNVGTCSAPWEEYNP